MCTHTESLLMHLRNKFLLQRKVSKTILMEQQSAKFTLYPVGIVFASWQHDPRSVEQVSATEKGGSVGFLLFSVWAAAD